MAIIGRTRQIQAGHDSPDPELNSAEPRYLTEVELAARWQISVKTLQRWRAQGTKPAFSKFLKSVRYPMHGLGGVLDMERVTLSPPASGQDRG